jgi:hypothetical protein
VHPDLKSVVELQQVDLKIAELTRQIDSLPGQIQARRSRLDEFIQAYEARKKRLAANQHERRELEGEIKVIQEKISKHKDQRYQVKTNEQFRAMTKEIEGEEARVRGMEDQILDKMLEAEELQKYVQEAASRLEGEKARVAAEIGQLETEQKADQEERQGLEARRDQLLQSLSESTRALYQRIRQARRGIAVAEVREGLCTACNVLLRPQVYNDVRTHEVLLTCENCGRIIYYLEPVPAQPDDSNLPGAEATA